MKRLTLIRHGKSSWEHEVRDHDRPLKKRATADASVVIDAFKAFLLQDRRPTLWSSSARRARGTAEMFKDKLPIDQSSFSVKTELYTFDSDVLKSIISQCPNSINDLIIVGHNPAITDLADELGIGSFDNVPTTGLVALEFETNNWADISDGRIVLFLVPKYLR